MCCQGVAVGITVKHAEEISHEEEKLLWDGVSTPTSVLNTKVLMLQGGTEHRHLKLLQCTFGQEHGPKGEILKYVEYVENGSKNHTGSYRDKGDKIIK